MAELRTPHAVTDSLASLFRHDQNAVNPDVNGESSLSRIESHSGPIAVDGIYRSEDEVIQVFRVL